MCSKQCRDENGFKCHLGSESHARQMALFGDAPAKVVDEFSRQFEEAWLEHMRRAHPTTRVRADVVYNELIQQRDHVHMNATRWHTLTEFVSHLGKAGLCRVDEDERGLHVTLAAADARVAGAEEARARRARQAAEAEARRAAALAAQAERARAEEARVLGFDAAARAKGGELVRKEGDAPVRLSVSGFGGGGVGGGIGGGGAGAAAAGNGGGAAASALLVPAIFSSETAVAATATAATAATAATSAAAEKSRERPKSKLELLMEQEQAAKRKRQEEEDEQEEKARANASSSSAAAAAAAAEKRHRANNEESTAPVPAAATAVPAADAPWLSRGLVVKIMAPELKASGHYKRKAVVVSIVVDDGGESNGAKKGSAAPATGFVAELETLDDDRDVLRVDQAQLETVLPGVGSAVRVVSSSATDAVNSSSKRKKGGEGGGGESGGGGDGNGSGSFSVSRFVGEEGRLSEVDAARYRARVTFDRSRSRRSEEKVKEEGGGESEWFEYEDICKVVAL